jgi:hypothetical protein
MKAATELLILMWAGAVQVRYAGGGNPLESTHIIPHAPEGKQ